MWYKILLPLGCSVVGCLLSCLALTAQSNQSFGEDLAILRLNMSTFGHLLPSIEESGLPSGPVGGSGTGKIIGDVLNKIGDTLEDAGSEIADSIADKLGVSQWYSLHVTGVCQGNFVPNATGSRVYNVTSCTDQANLTKLIESDLGFDFGLSRLWPDEVRAAVQQSKTLFRALLVLYYLSVCLTFSSVVACVAALLVAPKRLIVGNTIIAATAAVILLCASGAVSAVARGAHKVTDLGQGFGVSAHAGSKFLALSWVACVAVAATALFWAGMALKH